jgi:hypothetical protein
MFPNLAADGRRLQANESKFVLVFKISLPRGTITGGFSFITTFSSDQENGANIKNVVVFFNLDNEHSPKGNIVTLSVKKCQALNMSHVMLVVRI